MEIDTVCEREREIDTVCVREGEIHVSPCVIPKLGVLQ